MISVNTHVRIVSGYYEGYDGYVTGGDLSKNYVSVSVRGIHSLRFTPEQLQPIV